MKLKGKIAIVTGAARGMGRSHCLTLAAEGAHIVAADICQDVSAIAYSMAKRTELDETVAQVKTLGVKAIAVVADITSPTNVSSMVDTAIREFGRIDILVNNAGVALIGVPIQDVTEEQWDRLMDVNAKGPFLCCKYVVPHMIKQKYGRIVSISSHCGLVGIATLTPYNCSKHAVIGLTRTLAAELAQHGITANAVCPAAVNTPMLSEAYRLLGMSIEQSQKEWGAASLTNDIIPPEDISKAVAWLASDDARFITGRSILIGATNSLIP
ncbi:MAG: SDR family NAD(P)-dependent oxidoreductase [Capsulimonadaceae bacterium]